jgi:peptidoglycan/LPS O-acetylase OafA/YrhL
MGINIIQRLTGCPSIAARIQQTGGHASGFDYMRLALALSVISIHVPAVCYGPLSIMRPDYGPFRTVVNLVLPMFFTLGGFLVAGSLDRTRSLLTFAGLRVLRLMPALLVDTVFTALILGPLLTDVPLAQYFSAHQLHVFFFNIVGDPHYYLPGVFDRNVEHQVNGQLWTIPYELICYGGLALAALLGIYRRRWLFLFLTALFVCAQAAAALVLGPHFFEPRFMLIGCFLCGAVFSQFREYVPWSPILAIFALVIAQIALLSVVTRPLAILPAAYFTVFLGLTNPKRNALIDTGDYSYGLYLYGFPIQQALFAALPIARLWYGQWGLSLLASAIFAVLSWHLVEKHALAQKARLYRFEGWWLGKRSAIAQKALPHRVSKDSPR